MINDHLISGISAGAVSSLSKTAFNYLLNFMGLTNQTFPGLIAVVLLNSSQPRSLSPFLLGLVIDAIIGGIFGLMIIEILKLATRRYHWLKGLIFGSLIWLAGPVIVLPRVYPGVTLSFHYASLFDHWLFGILTVYLISKFYPVREMSAKE